MWHENIVTRKRIGDEAEKIFAKQVRCHCGGKFSFIGNLRPGFPDFTCENCGQLADVKYSPQAEESGNIAVSAFPWEHSYPPGMLLVTRIKGKWIGQYRQFIVTKNSEPYQSTHSTKPTKFYLIAWKQFEDLEDLGYRLSKTR